VAGLRQAAAGRDLKNPASTGGDCTQAAKRAAIAGIDSRGRTAAAGGHGDRCVGDLVLPKGHEAETAGTAGLAAGDACALGLAFRRDPRRLRLPVGRDAT